MWIFFFIWLPTTVGDFLSINQLLILTITNIKQVFRSGAAGWKGLDSWGYWVLLDLVESISEQMNYGLQHPCHCFQWSINFLYNFFGLLYLVFAWVPPFIFTIASVLVGVNSAISWNTTGQKPSRSLSHTHIHTHTLTHTLKMGEGCLCNSYFFSDFGII